MIDDWATDAIAGSEAYYRFQVMVEHRKERQREAIRILDSKAEYTGVED